MFVITKNISHFDLLRNPWNMSTNIVPRRFQESQIGEAPLSEMYIVQNPDDLDDSIGGRILDPQWIDSNLPGLWKSSCIRLHKGLCKGVPNEILSSTRPVWLVDIMNACLVPAPKDCSYVALSYVWGNHKTLQVDSANLSWLRQIGSLLKHQWATQIPRTIKDAIGVVKILAEKYLWVDSLCIVQDDETHKYTEMSKMAAIYANASVTILALQGQHANHGLPGFRDFSEPRNVRQSVHVLGKG
jgi:Heterokaryon incompatibility protein (HET)